MMSGVILEETAYCSEESGCPPPDEVRLLALCPVPRGIAGENSTYHNFAFGCLETPQGQGPPVGICVSSSWQSA